MWRSCFTVRFSCMCDVHILPWIQTTSLICQIERLQLQDYLPNTNISCVVFDAVTFAASVHVCMHVWVCTRKKYIVKNKIGNAINYIATFLYTDNRKGKILTLLLHAMTIHPPPIPQYSIYLPARQFWIIVIRFRLFLSSPFANYLVCSILVLVHFIYLAS